MASRDSDRSAEARARRLQFEGYLLDLDRGCLLLDGSEIALRPKTFAVLQFLVENAGRLVSKDEVIAAVWPEVTVTDDTLVQSIGELRRALGDDGARLIRTVPRRGYRFEAVVTPISLPETTASNVLPTPDAIDERPPAAIHRDSQNFVSESEPTVATSTTAPPANEFESELKRDGAARATRADGVPPTLRSRASKLLEDTRAAWRGSPTLWRGAAIAAMMIVAVLTAATVLRPRPSLEVNSPVARPSAVVSTASREIAARPAIAVLPFANLSDDQTREYFVNGVTQDIINALGRFSALTVMSWNAVAPYKAKPAPPAEIALGLSVRYLVEGSVRQAGDRVRVTAQLVGSDGRLAWSGRFEEAIADLFALQDKITIEIAGALAIHVTQAEQHRLLAKPTESLEAYDLVLRARPALQRPTRAGIVEARALLRRAIALDPNYAAAHSGLGETFHIAVSWGWAESPVAFLKRAEEAASKALQLNVSELRARILLGRIQLFYSRYEQAIAEMERAITINPSDADGLAGRGNILMWLGQTDAAIETLELAQRIDPELNAVDRFSLSLAYYMNRQYDAAIVAAEHNLRNSESSSFSHVALAAAYAQLGRDEDVSRVVDSIRRSYPTFDPKVFGNKLRKAADLEHLRDGLRKAGFDASAPGSPAQKR